MSVFSIITSRSIAPISPAFLALAILNSLANSKCITSSFQNNICKAVSKFRKYVVICCRDVTLDSDVPSTETGLVSLCGLGGWAYCAQWSDYVGARGPSPLKDGVAPSKRIVLRGYKGPLKGPLEINHQSSVYTVYNITHSFTGYYKLTKRNYLCLSAQDSSSSGVNNSPRGHKKGF